MKNMYWKGLLAGAVALCTIFGGASIALAEENTAVTTDGEAEASVKSYLTGEEISSSVGRRRPVAVMMGNNSQGAPQSGIANAGVVYEAPVEGDMTRLMGIFEDYDSLEKIGSVRSCRDYYVYYANEFDAIYAHFGQAVYALPYLENIDSLNGLYLDGTVFYRTSDRQAPHNAYTSFERLQSGINNYGFRQTYKDGYEGHYLFAEDGTETLLENGTAAETVTLGCYGDNRPWFEYNAETKEYSRFQYGAAHIDQETGEQLTCDNIILQYSAYQPYDSNGYLNINTTSGGSGKYITRGKAVDITWQKDSEWGITRYYDADGQEIRLNTGKTWVEIVLNDETGSVVCQ
jgi:hypothetical protein